LAAELSGIADEEVLKGVESALRAKGWLDARPSRPAAGRSSGAPKRPGPGLTIPRGDFEIIVGRKDVDNDAITFRIARGNDWWLHPLHMAGPHVLIRPGGQVQPPREVVMDAGQLALYFSKLRRSGKGDVMLTQRKYIQRAKGAKPGSVICRRYSTLFVKIDVDRVRTLLEMGGR
ncbi:NFACT RNA binding domain-containing protein, partial [Thermodesulfobacteriota bacterium]